MQEETFRTSHKRVGTSQERVEDSFLRLIATHERRMRGYRLLGIPDEAEEERAAMEKARAYLEKWRNEAGALSRARARLNGN